MNAPAVLTEPLGGSALSRAAQAGALPEWFARVPDSRDAWRTHADAVRASVRGDWLAPLDGAFDARGAARERLERAANDGIVITTGQQPGLFGGPLMTLVKALTARALADTLEESLGMPVAPVFWAATDDADFDEAAAVSVALDGGARELRLTHRPPAGTPMARAVMAAEVEELAAPLRAAAGSALHQGVLDGAVRAYHAGATVGSAYVDVLRDVLQPLGVAVLDVSHPAVAACAAPTLQRAAGSARAVAAAVHARSAALRAAGFEPQVVEVQNLSLVFLNENGIKRRLPLADAERGPTTADHGHLSATVLLRPVVERASLPTAAYVGGPGEIAYFAQVTAVADALDVPRPVVVPRWSMTIVEPRVQRILDRLSLDPSALARPDAAEGAIAREHLPADTAGALAALRATTAARAATLAAVSGDLLPVAVIDGLARTLAHRFDRLERRLLAGVKRREREVMRELATAQGALFPHGVRQERKLAYVPMLARYGPDLLDRMLAGARAHAEALVQRRAESSQLAPAAR